MLSLLLTVTDNILSGGISTVFFSLKAYFLVSQRVLICSRTFSKKHHISKEKYYQEIDYILIMKNVTKIQKY